MRYQKEKVESLASLCTISELRTFEECFRDKKLQFLEKRRSWFFYQDLETTEYVYKVIHLGNYRPYAEVEYSRKADLEDVQRELMILNCLSHLKSGSQNFCFPEATWLVLDSREPAEALTESMLRVDAGCGRASQLYAVFKLPRGEAITLGKALREPGTLSYREVLSVFAQLCLTLACAEQELEFEHRDLHVNNIYLCPTSLSHLTYYPRGKKIKVPTFGITAVIAEVGQARLKSGTRLYFKDDTGPYPKGHPLYILRQGRLHLYYPHSNFRYLQRHYKSLLAAYGQTHSRLLLPLISKPDDSFSLYQGLETILEEEDSRTIKDTLMRKLANLVRSNKSKKPSVGDQSSRPLGK